MIIFRLFYISIYEHFDRIPISRYSVILKSVVHSYNAFKDYLKISRSKMSNGTPSNLKTKIFLFKKG